MRTSLALVGAGGLFLIFSSMVSSSRLALLRRLRPSENRGIQFAERILALRESLRVEFVSQNRLKLAVSELPDILDLMSVSLSAGDGLFGALARVVPRANGVLADSLKKVLGSLELGADLDGELDWLSKSLPQRQVVEFTSKLSMALHKGAPLSQMLRSLAESTRAELRNDLLRRAGRNETRMLVPLVFLILPVTVLFAVYPSLQLLNIEYT
jgi:tight adherence protein C